MSDPDVAARGRVVDALSLAGCAFAEDEARLLLEAAEEAADLEELLARRVSGEPLEHVLGWAEFRGLRVAVRPGVFVPRRRTGLLVRLGVAMLRGRRPTPRVADLCCGSGAVALALAAEHAGPLQLYAVDLDPVAVACARANLDGTAEVRCGDLFEGLPPAVAGQLDLAVCSPPYVPSSEISLMPVEARDHEPRLALDGGPDGLDVARRVLEGAASWLAPTGGALVLECARSQAEPLTAAARGRGLAAEVVSDERLGATAVVAVRRAEDQVVGGPASGGTHPHPPCW